MSIALVIETQNEVRRLLIAGSDMAKEDFRLQKIVPAMKASGEKAPIFGRIAEAIEAVLNAAAGKTAESLLELANLVNAVLYTQGEVGLAGELECPDQTGFSFGTQIAFRRLNPVKEALTSTGSGRYEIVQQAFNEGVFKDLRLIEPLVGALDDPYGELANLAERILKEYGAELKPILLKKLNLQGGKSAGRLADLLAAILGKEGKELYLQWCEQGAPEVKAAAIRALKDQPDCINLLIDFSKDKKKDIREAAYQALAFQDSEIAVERLYEVFKGKDWEIVVEPLRTSRVIGVTPFLLAEAGQLLDALLTKDAENVIKHDTKDGKPEINRLAAVLACLEGKADPAALQFYRKCLGQIPFLNKLRRGYHYDYRHYNDSSESLAGMVANNIMQFGTVEAYQILDELEGKHSNCLLGYAFEAALHYRTPVEVFDTYSDYLKKSKKNESNQILQVIRRYVNYAPAYRSVETDDDDDVEESDAPVVPKEPVSLDQRWCKLLIVAKETELVSRFARPGDELAIGYLLKVLENKPDVERDDIRVAVRGLIQAHYDKIGAVVLQVLQHSFTKKNNYYLSWYLASFVNVLKFLPAEHAQMIEDFAKDYHNDAAAKLFELAQHLKQKQQ